LFFVASLKNEAAHAAIGTSGHFKISSEYLERTQDTSTMLTPRAYAARKSLMDKTATEQFTADCRAALKADLSYTVRGGCLAQYRPRCRP
jgi:hypothetical protein